MKTKLKTIGTFLLMVVLIIVSVACNDDDSSTAKISFSRSIYILPPSGNLTVELRASIAPEANLNIPVIIEGSAILGEDYEISAKEFVIKAGETSATLILTPKNNLTANREIRLSINPVSGYDLGDKRVAMIPIEIKERIMYTFKPTLFRLLSEIDIRVELQGENSGSKFRAPTDIVLPLEVSSSSTATLNKDFEIEKGITSVTIKQGSYYAVFKIKIKEGAEDYTGKTAVLKLSTPADNPDLYYPGSFLTYNIKLDQLKFTDMLGKWKPVGIINMEAFYALDVEESDLKGLPINNDATDYLEFVHEDNGTDKVIPHLKGDLKNFFSNKEGHKIVFDHIEKDLDDFATWETYDAPYFIISQVNKCFSSKVTKLENVFLGIDKVDDNNIIVYFHQYEPTDFLKQTFNDYFEGEWDPGSCPELLGITYSFTRIKE